MAHRLLPCPFCSSISVRLLSHSDGWRSVSCITCGAMKREFTDFDETVVAGWNMRDGRPDPVTEKTDA